MDEEGLLAIIARHSGREGPLLPILHDIQQACGCVPAEAIPLVAESLNLSRAEVHGTISFYHDFRQAPAARPVIRLCRAEACQARGADRVAAALAPLDQVDVEAVYCLGLCASGPSAMIGGQVFARLDESSAVALAREAG
jgi:formate dehydrogenase subunit gamma